jgi:tetratricopeptide (TPR) repeat protein
VGRMLIDLGLLQNAENLFRDMAKRNPQSADAQQGLADAEFAEGNYAGALQAYRRLTAIDPANAYASQRAEEADRILALDPAAPGLKAAVRYARSRDLLLATLDAIDQCFGGEDKLPASIGDAATEARAAVARKRKPESFSDAADANVQLVLQLWKARPAACAADDAVVRTIDLLKR